MKVQLETLRECRPPWPRQITTPITVQRVHSECSGSLPAPQSGHTTAVMVLFAYLLFVEDLDHHQNVISSPLYHPGFASNPFITFLSNVAQRPIDRQSNQCYQKHNLLLPSR